MHFSVYLCGHIYAEELSCTALKLPTPEVGAIFQVRGSTDQSKVEESSGKTLMELHELEMRARAIKALLKRQEAEDEEVKCNASSRNEIKNHSSLRNIKLSSNATWADQQVENRGSDVYQNLNTGLQVKSCKRMKQWNMDKCQKNQHVEYPEEGEKRIKHFHVSEKGAMDTSPIRLKDDGSAAFKVESTNILPTDLSSFGIDDLQMNLCDDIFGIQEVDIELGSGSSSFADQED